MRILRVLFLVTLALMVSTTSIAARGQTYHVLYNFGSNGGGPTCPLDSGMIAQGRDGNLYSTASDCGHGLGTAFRMTPAGALTVLHSFNGTDGQATQSGLTLGTDGNFYGTTVSGGLHSSGTIFKMTPDGSLTTLYNFTGGNNGTPTSPPIEGFDGNFYGRTVWLDVNTWAMGSPYRITPSGVFTQFHEFIPPRFRVWRHSVR